MCFVIYKLKFSHFQSTAWFTEKTRNSFIPPQKNTSSGSEENTQQVHGPVEPQGVMTKKFN